MQPTRTRAASSGMNARSKELEFKYLYFKIQKLISKKIQISLKYEQLKQPEINLTMIKPIALKIIELANSNSLYQKINGGLGSDFRAMIENKLSIMVVYILMLLRYEYLIQSESNLIICDLLTTKANVCELLAIRILREFKAVNRVKLLFINPLKQFNTLELCILTNSKKFLSQPIIILILDKFYNGVLIKQELTKVEDEETSLLRENITNYKYQKVTLSKINHRSIIVPKYQSLVINIKNIIFTAIHILIILNQHATIISDTYLELIFYGLGLNFSYEFIMKVFYINHQFLTKILWFYLDFTLVVLINFNLILKIACIFDQIDIQFYYQIFSLLSILLFPRNLAIFNNYKFFNLIVLSFKNMIWNMAAMFCLFLSLVIGFYVSFISMNKNRSNLDIAFDLLKIFFGFTPAVWSNWETYSAIGKIIQISYLFLSQFIISTILAIVLSEVFSEESSNIKENFEFFKAVNLVIYFKSSTLFSNKFGLIIKFPILLIIYAYELTLASFSKNIDKSNEKYFTFLDKEHDYYADTELVNLDYVNDDSDLSLLIKSRKNSVATNNINPNIFNPIVPSGVTTARNYSQVENMNANSQFAATNTNVPPTTPNFGPTLVFALQPTLTNGALDTHGLVPIKSISTLGNFKSASTDSLFIDDLLTKKYRMTGININKNNHKTKELDKVILEKLNQLEDKLDKLNYPEDNSHMEDINNTILEDAETNSVNLYNIRETSYDGSLINSEDELSDPDTLSNHSDDTF